MQLRLIYFAGRQIPKRSLLLFALVLLLPAFLFAQLRQVSGSVTDRTGNPVAGATIKVKNSTAGTSADSSGRFSVDVPKNGTLIISSVNYETQEVTIDDRLTVNIVLKPVIGSLKDVVVVGYGVSSKKKLVASVSKVSGEGLNQFPTSNILQALEGRAKGVFVMTQGSQPGALPSISIRGGGEPLYVIDGVPSSKSEFASISPADIESFSILKDAAAAAVYGSRAGNGIVMVTTKRGGGPTRITYNTYTSASMPTIPVKFISPEKVAEARDRASLYNGGRISYMNLDANGNLVWDPKKLDSIKRGILNNTTGNTDWADIMFEKYASSQTHDLSVSGGTKATKFLMSGRYSEQNGIFKNDVANARRYSARMNVSHLFENIGLTVTGMMTLSQNDTRMPPQSLWTIMTAVFRANSMGRAFNEFGNPTGGEEAPNLAISPDAGYRKNREKFVNTRLSLDWAVPGVKGLSFKTSGNYRWYDMFQKNWYANARGAGQSWNLLNEKEEMGAPHLDQAIESDYDYNLDISANYNKQLGKHRVEALLLYNEAATNTMNMAAERREYTTGVIEQLNGGPSSTATNSGTASFRARRGIVGRLNYDFAGKYIVEANFRYDGSDKFPKGRRWGLFPSVSAGWNIDEESFMKSLKDRNIINTAKIRGSWGQVGLDDVGDFQYFSVFNIGPDFYQDGAWTPTLTEGPLVSPDLTWYTRNTFNLGVELSSLNSRLSTEIDYFYYRTTGFLATPQNVYTTPLGKALPVIKTNSAQRRAGWELALNWRDRVNEFTYSVGLNGAYYQQLWEKKYDELESDLRNPYTRLTQQTLYYDRMYTAEGLYQNMQEVLDNPRRTAATTLRPGDIRYVDINGDGVISGADQIRQGKPRFPQLYYGISLSAGWRGLAIDLLFQGTGARDMLLEGYTRRFTTDQIGMLNSDNFYYPGNTSNPIYPRYTNDANTNSGNNGGSGLNSTYWLKDAMYLRLKDVKISYNLSKTLLKNIKTFSDCTIYLSGFNVLTFSKLKPYGLDPEDGRSGETTSTLGYPVQKLYSLGLNVAF